MNSLRVVGGVVEVVQVVFRVLRQPLHHIHANLGAAPEYLLFADALFQAFLKTSAAVTVDQGHQFGSRR